MDDRDVLIMEEYLQQCTMEVDDESPHDTYFKLHSYSRWAANEILQRVMCEAMKLPPHISGREHLTLEEIVEDFVDEMDYYSYVSDDIDMREIFQIARDEGKCILLYICSSQ